MATNISNDLVWQITRTFDLWQFHLGLYLAFWTRTSADRSLEQATRTPTWSSATAAVVPNSPGTP
jgi:hypothetical protein